MNPRDQRVRDERRDEELTTADLASTPPRTHEGMREAEMRSVAGAPMRPEEEGRAALFPRDELDHLKSRWGDIQAEFVDEPRKSVEEADGLVASTIKRLAESFADARTNLEGQWARGGDVSTEDLRLALRRYRSFFDRLLAV